MFIYHHNIPNMTHTFSLAVEGEAGLLAIGCSQFTPVFFVMFSIIG